MQLQRKLVSIFFTLALFLPAASFAAWQSLPGAANDIAVGGDNKAWVIGTASTAGGYGIYNWRHNQWRQVKGGAVAVAVDIPIANTR